MERGVEGEAPRKTSVTVFRGMAFLQRALFDWWKMSSALIVANAKHTACSFLF